MGAEPVDLPPDVRARYPFAGHHLRVNGWRMHYLDEGDPAADPVLLLHGNPTWSYLWRDVIPPLVAAGHRVIAPDHVGFGLSDKPTRAQDHSLANHIANLGALVDRLDLRRLTVVGQDWGGPIGLAQVLLRPERVRALAVMSTWAWPAPPAEFHTRRFPWRVMHAPLSGPFLLGRRNALAARGIYLSVVGRDRFRAESQAAYEAVLNHPERRLLTWTFPRYIPLGPETATAPLFAWLEAGLRGLTLPVLVVWGREDDVFPPSFAERFLEMFPNASGPHWVTGRHFLQEDSADDIARLLVEFLEAQR